MDLCCLAVNSDSTVAWFFFPGTALEAGMQLEWDSVPRSVKGKLLEFGEFFSLKKGTKENIPFAITLKNHDAKN